MDEKTEFTKNKENQTESLRSNNEDSGKTADVENIQATNQESVYIQIQQQYRLTPELTREETEANLPTPQKKSPDLRKGFAPREMAARHNEAENSKQEKKSPPGGA